MIVSYDTIMKAPPFTIDAEMLRFCAEIERLLGQISSLSMPAPQPKLRRQNRIRTIKDTLAIEGNTLSLDQVTAIMDGRKVLGPKSEIVEVRNAIELYSQLDKFTPFLDRDFLKAHRILMTGLIPNAGKYRSGNVGVLKGSKVSHMAPPSRMVPQLMKNLFGYLKTEKILHPLIKAAIAHYEIEFIHPFEDGNGRIGRFWQTVMMAHYHQVFGYLPTESVIRERQMEYYRELERSDKTGSLNPFILFSLKVIHEALTEFARDFRVEPMDVSKRLEIAREHFRSEEFSRADYLRIFKVLSTATASRDLAYGVQQKVLQKKGDRRKAKYRFRSV
jgi:Fic family protein